MVRAHNAGPDFAPLIAAMLEAAGARQRVRERAKYVRIAAALAGGDDRSLASRLWRRMRELARLPLAVVPIDLATTDGALRAALLVNKGKPLARSAVYDDMFPLSETGGVFRQSGVVYARG